MGCNGTGDPENVAVPVILTDILQIKWNSCRQAQGVILVVLGWMGWKLLGVIGTNC